MQKLTTVILLFLFVTTSVRGQESSKSGDPFQHDPFFDIPSYQFEDSDIERDSTFQKPKVKGLVRNLNGEGLDFRGVIESGPYNSNPLYSVYPSLPMIHYNRVSSLFLGYRKERMQWHEDNELFDIPDIRTHGLIGFSTGLQQWQYSLGLEKLLGDQEHIIIGGEFHNATATDDQWRTGLNENSVTAFMAGYDYLDYYKQKGWGAYLLARTDRYFEGGIAFSDDQYSTLQRQTTWALFGADGRFRQNPPVAQSTRGSAVDAVNISSLTFSASFNPKQLMLGHNFTFAMDGIAEFADPGIGTHSDFSFSKYTGQLKSYVNFEPGGVLKYRLRMSSITGHSPRFKQLFLGGVGTLRALPYKSLGGGNQMLLSNAVLQFGQPKASTGGWIDFEDFYLSLFLDSGWINYESELENAQSPLKGFGNFEVADLVHNGGIGVGSSLLRAEMAWNLNEVSQAPVFWLRLNPTF